MNILITARKDFISSEVSTLKKYNDDILSADIKLSYLNSKDSVKSAEIIVQVPGQVLSATEETDDFEKSVSSAVEKLSRQLKKLKTRRIQKVR
jgi:putative sigma-54 modulation protein